MSRYDFLNKYGEHLDDLIKRDPSNMELIQETAYLIYMIGERDGFMNGKELITDGEKAA